MYKFLTCMFCLALGGVTLPVNVSYARHSFKVHTDFIDVNKKNNIVQFVYILSDSNRTVSLDISCFKFMNETDSVTVFQKRNIKTKCEKRLTKAQINYSLSDTNTYILSSFSSAVRRTSLIPPGSYKVYINIRDEADTERIVVLREIDSNLSVTTPLYKEVNSTLLPLKNKLIDLQTSGNSHPYKTASATNKVFNQSKKRLDKLARTKNLNAFTYTKDNNEIIEFYYNEWFVGKYQKTSNVSLSDQLYNEQEKIEHNITSFTDNSIEQYQSLFSQISELKKNKKDNTEATGQIGLSSNFSNGQEEYSGTENNYYEVYGDISFPVFDIPVLVQGLYTSQDNNRSIKTSYFRFSYDAEKAKSELLELINQYNQKYSETSAKGKGIEQVYGSYLRNLKNQEQTILSELNNPKIDRNKPVANLFADDSSRSLGKVKDLLDSVSKLNEKIENKRAQLEDLRKKIDKYQKLVDQYKNTSYFDSLLAYDKLKDLQNSQDLSYKQLAKKADAILPEGRSKKIIAGLTNFDAGIFPKYVSKYTVAGQTIKGVDFGYDLGPFELGGTIGKTEFISRDGEIDKYSNYSARLKFKAYKKQKVGFVYYGYMPNRKMLSEDFFGKIDIAMPAFKSPVHILSMVYEGRIDKYVNIDAEIATSLKSTSKESVTRPIDDHSAYQLNIEGVIPESSYSILASYEHTGKFFENDAMPVSMAGTDRYKVGIKGDLFKSILSGSIEYNYLLQENFSSKASNVKWGFDLKTNTKRFPSVTISYKPFTTFRSYNDTFSVPQKPVLGEVWTGRIGYQIKKKLKSIRFQLVYNANSSLSDSDSYKTTTVQFSSMYINAKFTGALSMGLNSLQTNRQESISDVHGDTRFANVMVGYAISDQVTISAGQDLGLAGFGLSKYGAMAGAHYRFQHLPIIIKGNVKFNTYRTTEDTLWKQLFGGTIDLVWQFRFKILDK